jgi:hypothetical protein
MYSACSSRSRAGAFHSGGHCLSSPSRSMRPSSAKMIPKWAATCLRESSTVSPRSWRLTNMRKTSFLLLSSKLSFNDGSPPCDNRVEAHRNMQLHHGVIGQESCDRKRTSSFGRGLGRRISDTVYTRIVVGAGLSRGGSRPYPLLPSVVFAPPRHGVEHIVDACRHLSRIVFHKRDTGCDSHQQ